jgi:hypothetical protein
MYVVVINIFFGLRYVASTLHLTSRTSGEGGGRNASHMVFLQARPPRKQTTKITMTTIFRVKSGTLECENFCRQGLRFRGKIRKRSYLIFFFFDFYWSSIAASVLHIGIVYWVFLKQAM